MKDSEILNTSLSSKLVDVVLHTVSGMYHIYPSLHINPKLHFKHKSYLITMTHPSNMYEWLTILVEDFPSTVLKDLVYFFKKMSLSIFGYCKDKVCLVKRSLEVVSTFHVFKGFRRTCFLAVLL